MSRGPLLIVGASGRAAAASALRAGFEPFVIDLFADADTRRLCKVKRCPWEAYPSKLLNLARIRKSVPVMYTGGLENYPDLIEQLANSRPLYGNGPQTLMAVRDPVALAAICEARGLPYTAARWTDDGLPKTGRWLRKPRNSAGGLGIRFAVPTDVTCFSGLRRGHFFQRFVPGRPMSAVFVSRRRHCELLGTTEQLIGERWLHARPFGYAGNIGPVDAPNGLLELGAAITEWADLRGLWGLDFVLRDEIPVPIEINPRYPASIEVLELACGVPMLDRHVAVFEKRLPEFITPPHRCRVVAKAIYYAPRRLKIPDSGPWSQAEVYAATVWRRPDFADIPNPGTVIEPGQPVLTILTEATDESACLNQLKCRAAELDHLFEHTTTGETGI